MRISLGYCLYWHNKHALSKVQSKGALAQVRFGSNRAVVSCLSGIDFINTVP